MGQRKRKRHRTERGSGARLGKVNLALVAAATLLAGTLEGSNIGVTSSTPSQRGGALTEGLAVDSQQLQRQ